MEEGREGAVGVERERARGVERERARTEGHLTPTVTVHNNLSEVGAMQPWAFSGKNSTGSG